MGVGRLAVRGSESSGKLPGTQVRDGCEVLDSDCACKIGLDETGDPVELPRSEAVQRRFTLRLIPSITFRLQKTDRSLNVLICLVLVSGQRLDGEAEEANSNGQ